MATSAQLVLPVERYEPCVRTIIVRGLDLRGAVMRSQVRPGPDVPGPALIDLATVTTVGAQGIRVADFVVDGGVPVSTLEIVIDEASVMALPYAGRIGGAAALAYDLQATVAGRKRKLFGGAFIVLPGVTGADNAPTIRPGDQYTGQPSPWSTATIAVSADKSTVALVGLDLIDSVLGRLLAIRADARARIEARALLFGIAKVAQARLWAAEATEAAYADGVYRDGYITADGFAQMPDVDVAGPLPIDGRGLFVAGDTAAGLVRPATGDVTFVIEADVPPHDGALRVLGSYVGNVLESRVAVFRSVTGVYALQVYNGTQGEQTIGDLADPTARRIRVAVSIGAKMTRASFAGRPPVAIAADRPASLLRLWSGNLAKGQTFPLGGYVLRTALYRYAVSDEQLQSMSGGPVTDDEVHSLIDEKIATHDHDRESHELAPLRAQIEILQARSGAFPTRASDNFDGADGPLGAATTGGIAWTTVGTNPLHRIGNVCRTPDGAIRGAYLQAGVLAGQIEADLAPGNGEASLYIRIQSSANYLLLQRTPEGFIGLYRFTGGAGTVISPSSIYRTPVASERFKVLLLGPRIWVFRVVAGVEEQLFDVTETTYQTVGSHGIRLRGTGSADNFRILQREAI